MTGSLPRRKPCRRVVTMSPPRDLDRSQNDNDRKWKGAGVMGLLLLILVIFLLFGGGGYYGYRSGYYGGAHYGGGLGLIVLILVLFLLFGGVGHHYPY